MTSSAAAEEFYCDRLGFRQAFAYRPFGGADPCYMGLTRDNVEVHISSFPGDGVAGGVVFLGVEDVDELHKELNAKGVIIDLEPTDQSWGNREMYVHESNNARSYQTGAWFARGRCKMSVSM